MSFVADAIAGCAPGTNECVDQSVMTDINGWGLVLFLIVAVPLLLAVAAGAVLLVRRGVHARSNVPSRVEEPPIPV